MILAKLIIPVLALLIYCSVELNGAVVPIDDCRSVDQWRVNDDGGLVEISRDEVNTRDGKPSMRLRFSFSSSEHHYGNWGNAARAIALPPNAHSVEFDVSVEQAIQPAALYVWFFEADGDGWVAAADIDGKRLSELPGGWRHCMVPVSSFVFDPRGNKVREPLTTNKLLIGLGSGNATINIANLVFRTTESVGTVPDSRTPDLKIADGKKGRVAILCDAFQPAPGHSDPNALASVLQKAGWGVTLLKSGDLADPKVLNTSNFDCLLLPYGPCWPHAALDNIKAYLKSGGSFFSTGGYTFDQPCVTAHNGKLIPADGVKTAADLAREDTAIGRLNTRHGKYGDTLALDADQIGVFDPSYHLLYAESIKGPLVDRPLRTKVAGYAACATLGNNNPVFAEKWRTYTPLLEAVDAPGRSRGPVGALVYNYAGPYTGSSWAFFGVTNTDLFKTRILDTVPEIIDALTARTFLHTLFADRATYNVGETVKLNCKVANLGRQPADCSVAFRVYDRGGKLVHTCDPIRLSLSPGTTKDAASEFRLVDPSSDLCRVTAMLTAGGKQVFSDETGFAVYDAAAKSSGPKLSLKDNYMRIGDRPVLLSGTNVTGEIFVTDTQNPLIWDRDLARMNENGLNIVRVVHFSPFVEEKRVTWPPKAEALDVDALPQKLERQLDGLVQLCQKHNIVMLLDLHEWIGLFLTDGELAVQRKWAKLIASRYRGVPGMMIDIENEPNIDISANGRSAWPPHIARLWDEFKLANPGLDEAFAVDLFRNRLIERWIGPNLAGLKEGDSDRLVTVGFLQEYWALNKLMCVDTLDFANMHSYNSIETFRADFKLFDRRFEGKSISLGEFGALPDHEKRVQGLDNPGQDHMRFLRTGHYVFGEGGTFIANWCWKDMDAVVFPWGVNYTCGGPRKDILKAYRNQSMLFRQVKPEYRPPDVWLVVPVEKMLGGGAGTATNALYDYVQALLDERVDFGVIDDKHLDMLPASAKVVIRADISRKLDEMLGELRQALQDGKVRRIASSGHAFALNEADGSVTIILANPKNDPDKVQVPRPDGTMCSVELGPLGVGLLRFDAAGRLVACEAQGMVKMGDHSLQMRGHFALFVCDSRDIWTSREMVVLPFGPGEIDLSGCAGVKSSTIQCGDLIDGKWRKLSETAGRMITALGSESFDIRLVAPKDRLSNLAGRVVSELTLRN